MTTENEARGAMHEIRPMIRVLVDATTAAQKFLWTSDPADPEFGAGFDAACDAKYAAEDALEAAIVAALVGAA